MSTDLHTLSGAYAVDALSAEEAQAFDTHLEECQACRDEVRELQEAAARMGASEAVAPPPALRARVLAAADQLPQLPPKVTPARAPHRAVAGRRGVLSAAAAVVLVVAARLRGQPEPAGPAEHHRLDRQVFAAPDAHTKTVDDRPRLAHGRHVPEPGPDGGRDRRPAEAAARAGPTRCGPSTPARPPRPGLLEDLEAGKVMSMPSAGTTVAITVEPAGGSTEPTSKPIVTVDPEQV